LQLGRSSLGNAPSGIEEGMLKLAVLTVTCGGNEDVENRWYWWILLVLKYLKVDHDLTAMKKDVKLMGLQSMYGIVSEGRVVVWLVSCYCAVLLVAK
jgi:hypothetical protein